VICSVEALLPAAILFPCFSSCRFNLDGAARKFFFTGALPRSLQPCSCD